MLLEQRTARVERFAHHVSSSQYKQVEHVIDEVRTGPLGRIPFILNRFDFLDTTGTVRLVAPLHKITCF
jgi:hypothetical protein